ncbi:MAG: hypothetical protein IKX18_04480 [Muribaculaceae bacterium]|nr:hypothetical protein [Muribaculaceae bacterium]
MKKLLFFSLVLASLAFVSCGSDEDDEPNYTNQTLLAGESYTIPGKDLGWTSDNELIASVSNGVVTAEHVGETVIRNGSKSFKVIVTPKYNTFKEPYMNFGASMSSVKSFMSGYTLNQEKSEALLYDGKFPVMYYMYTFKNGGMYLSSAILKSSSVDTDEMVAFMTERYVFVTMDQDKYYFGFISPDQKTIVILQLDTLNYQVVYEVIYTAYTPSSSSPAEIIKSMRKQIPTTLTGANAEVKAEYSRLLDVMP